MPGLMDRSSGELEGWCRQNLWKAVSHPTPRIFFSSALFLCHCHQAERLYLQQKNSPPRSGTHPPGVELTTPCPPCPARSRASWNVLSLGFESIMKWWKMLRVFLSSLLLKKQTPQSKKKKQNTDSSLPNCAFQRKPVSRFKWTMRESHDSNLML